MYNPELAEKIRLEIQPYLENQGVDLVELQCVYAQGSMALRLLVDYPQGGISIAKCSALNRQISDLLDSKEIINEAYVLEVSSPGLDRPLKTKADFIRSFNREAHFFLLEPVNGAIEIKGVIKDADEEFVYIAADNGELKIPLVKLIKAKQVV